MPARVQKHVKTGMEGGFANILQKVKGSPVLPFVAEADAMTRKVVVTPKDGKPQTLYFDQESNLAVRVDMVVENPMGTIPFTSYMSDYRDIDGILIPHTVEVEVMGQKRVIKTESVEHNVELPADRFALPAEVRSILEQEAGDAAAEVESTNE